MQLLELFHELTVRPQNAKELKGLILQLAVQGKLTVKWREENPNTESASKLLKRIQAEKEQLIKEKKIKKDKPLPPVTEEEIPYELPEVWEWCRMMDYLDVRDGTHDTPKYVERGVPLVTSKNLYTKRLDLTDVKYISEDDHFEISKRSFVERDDILFAMIGSIGNPVIVDVEPNFSIKNVALIKYYSKELVVPKYVLNFLEFATEEFKQNADGAVQSFVSLTKLRNKEFPLPPFEEQKAIVKIVESLFKEIEQLETLTEERIQLKEDFATSALRQLNEGNTSQQWQQLQPQFSTFFDNESNIKKLRESILQLAVQGKLTANWRAERASSGVETEPASELLKRIQAEKERLIKEKKIKKEKPLPPISEEEMPYALPEGWEWSYLGNSMLKITDGTHHSPTNVENGAYKYVTAKNIKDYGIELNNITYVMEEVHNEIYSRCNPEYGDLLYIKDGATTGICCLNNLQEEFSMLSSVALLKQPKEILGGYLLTVMRSPYYYELMRAGMSGVAITRVTLKKLKESPIAIPPLEEQKAIVEKVNQLMAYSDELEEQVKQSQTHAAHLMQSVLREVFEN